MTEEKVAPVEDRENVVVGSMEQGKGPETHSGFSIRTMALADLSLALGWAAEEGWNPGLDDARSFYAADPGGFFLGEIEGEPVGCISGVRYCDDFGFIGLYIVRPGYRGRGFGMALWNHALGYLAGCNIGLDGVVAQQGNYARSGFRLAHRNIRYELAGAGGSRAVYGEGAGTDWDVVALGKVDQDALVDYDRRMFVYGRRRFLERWTTQPGAAAFGAVSAAGKVQGYTVMRPCGCGYKIGPLFADSKEIAYALCGACLGAAGESVVYLDIPEPNGVARELVTYYGMKPVFETARMYTQGDPELPLDCIYGISSFELG